MTIRALAAALGCLIALHLPDSASAAQVTNVATPSGSTHGALIGGNIPCAIGANEIGDCGKSAPAGAIVGTTDVQTLTNKTISGAQNTLSAIPDSALSANVYLLSGAQSSTGLKTFSGGLALPIGTNPSGSSLYQDSNGNLHFVSPWMDVTFCGAKASGDTSRCWFSTPRGSFITQLASAHQPNSTDDLSEYYDGGSGLTFNYDANSNLGKGWNVKTTGDFSGAATITVQANANIGVGQHVYGSCVPSGDTVSSYSSGIVVLSVALTPGCILPSGSTVSFVPTINVAPGNAHTVGQYVLNSYTNGATGTGVGLASYAFGYSPGTSQILFGLNVSVRSLTGRKSSVDRSGMTNEFDMVASGPDDAENRAALTVVGAENGPSIDGATSAYFGVLLRPSGANAQVSPNPFEFVNGYSAVTMYSQPSGGVGEYGKIDNPFFADSCAISCFTVTGGSFTAITSAVASVGQNYLEFPLGTNINPGQLVTAPNLPVNTTVTSVLQCWVTSPIAGCLNPNETLVSISNATNGTIANGATITIEAEIPDGAVWSANFVNDFANWTNTSGQGRIKAGTTNNSGTVLTITGFGEDSANTSEVDYGDLNWTIDNSAHGGTLGHVGITNAGFTVGSPSGGNEGVGTINATAIYVNGVAISGGGGGTVTVSGSPSTGNLAKFSGTTSITNGDASGDCATSGTLAFTCTKTNGVLFGTAATQNTGTSGATIPLLNAANTFGATQTFADGTAAASTGFTFGANIAMGNHNITGVNNLNMNNAAGSSLVNQAASSTAPTLLPNRGDTKAGIGAVSSGSGTLIADISGSATDIADWSGTGFILNHGAYYSGATAGVTCSGSPTTSFASTNGIVTHC